MHVRVQQAGLNLDLEEKAVPSSTNYEEIKEQEAESGDSDDSGEETINTQEATSVTESKQSEVKKEERKLVDREYVS